MTKYDYLWRATVLAVMTAVASMLFSMASEGNELALILVTGCGVVVIGWLSLGALSKVITLFFALNGQENLSLLNQQAESIKFLGAANKTLTGTAQDLDRVARIVAPAPVLAPVINGAIHTSWDDLNLHNPADDGPVEIL